MVFLLLKFSGLFEARSMNVQMLNAIYMVHCYLTIKTSYYQFLKHKNPLYALGCKAI